ncbi:TIGR03862 family flavoprotein [Oryzisolibacter sp. LB2S]|uniref:TIGR03862 family flavoprotein n=1 Tax=Alicycliphilus soli TaxID=3228789 RepID=UPI00345A84E0
MLSVPVDAPHSSSRPLQCDVAVIGAGPAGLMAAEVAAAAGMRVHVFDAMPSVGRKFLLAGKGGLNLTHSEPLEPFLSRYGERRAWLAPWLHAFGPAQLRAWADALGAQTFVGSSGRVFPKDMKAAPLLRAWLHRLRGQGVRLHMRHRWLGWADGASDGGADGGAAVGPQQLRLAAPAGELQVAARAVVLALGGASWPRLGSDAAWVPLLAQRGVAITPLVPANCGFDVPRVDAPLGETRRAFFLELLGRGPAPAVGWTPHFAQRFAGQPFKSVALSFTDSRGRRFDRRGEFVATATGVEGSLIYAVSALLRDEIAAHGHASFHLDLLPDHTPERVLAEVRHPRGSRSLTSHLKGRLGLEGIKTAILYEQLGREGMNDPVKLAHAIKQLPITVIAARPVQEAISTAGGVAPQALDAHLMLQAAPGVFCAGEMLDWEAPTGGYLLTACCATGRAAGEGALRWLARQA